ncbi:hypothetical protein GLOTRDRAFT_105364 [Gloeophyllum trabeum ATCC 11539]|uniref:Zn(2)-C6 fungal-type domain-containing protein n=1 Tax=Gloeophyllum trabeum (strain ATCC 11539 / FP-39264 / Madison 617) TaxID=670483 RepID=S7RUC6_GLOTA|nr:uncharacterized protein GLOTRDRAFT_105364 [Gloeophyllum trabeum ATCC 11539]EPQ56794.1 hypothetical protein GLOTRDRAFT_105364 [Gloeophyllum trabeum ATCC 11539]
MDSSTNSSSASAPQRRSKSSTSSPGPPFPMDARMPVSQSHFAQEAENRDLKQGAACKVPKRKRLAKACDACHKSKRRCDGTGNYFASKECTYTDASGRPVPAPRAGHPSEDTQRSSQAPLDGVPSRAGPSAVPAIRATPQMHPVKIPSPLAGDQHEFDDSNEHRKRRRIEQGPTFAGPPIPSPPQAVLVNNPILDRSSSPDAALTRELVNLFFTHCHPSRLILHKPSFSAALSHNGVPPYLLHAMYALAAPLSKQPGIRTTPARLAGKRFFNDAVSMMFDSTGRLCCPPDLVTAQALCLLQMHMLQQTTQPIMTPIKYHDLALGIVENLGVYKPDNPVITPMPSAEHVHSSIERECTRRVFWFIYLLELLRQTYSHRSMMLRPEGQDLSMRLPVDETSFELAVHITLPAEYLHFPPPRMPYTSEFGHIIRVTKIMTEFETKVCPSCNGGIIRDDRAHASVLQETEIQLDTWAQSLADHLRFNEQNVQLQVSMFETSSNTGAWCFFFMHAVHASCVLAINELKQRAKGEPPNAAQEWSRSCLNQILSSMGNRAKNSFILAVILWPLYKYCKEDNQQLREWAAAYQDFWGVDLRDLALNSQSPHAPDLYTPPGGASSSSRSDYSLPLHHTITKPESSDPYTQDGRTERQDGPLLPSLKASGLLDSWRPVGNSNGPAPAGNAWNPSITPPSGREQNANTMDPSRHAAAGVPVGMPWLANEP